MNALLLAECSQLAYEDLPTVKAAFPLAGVTLIDRDDSQAYVIEFPERTIVAFRGTQVTSGFSMTDVVRNAHLEFKSWDGQGRIHCGYKEATQVIAEDVLSAIARVKRPIFYTGHSLGGSVATIMRALSPNPTVTVTFGAPKVGDKNFVQVYSHIPLVRYVHADDIAPKHARPWLGYRHGGTFKKISSEGRVTERKWRWYDELILPFGLTRGTFDHRIGEYVDKLRGAET